ncbi:GTP cyclohydrolase II [Cognatishimia sp. WU-CL00825]|uniref:GTP cyclohydrolase II n=1 Tax=Cognatishimia sp. WU-CL00825 TaxID=3127658 RepID=UPI0031036A52
MSFSPDIQERLARARADLRMGVPIVVTGNGQSILVASSETIAEQRLKDIQALDGETVLVITARRAETLKARAYDTELARIVMPADAKKGWVGCVSDPAGDLKNPMKGPFKTQRGGDVSLHRLALKLMKSAQLLPAAVIKAPENAAKLALEHGLTVIPEALAAPYMSAASPMNEVVHARLPIRAAEAGKLHIFRPENGEEEHYAIEIGQPSREAPVLARLHSACFTGDVLGSLKCDCGPQLNGALAQMGAEGAGVLLYLNQEGRGIGLANKMRAYSLQDQGFDTVQANHRLGFEDDERDFRIGANLLKKIGFSSVRLLTNNPKKIKMMQDTGVEVTERVALQVGENAYNAAYLATKAKKSGHLL